MYGTIDQPKIDEVCNRCYELKDLNREGQLDRRRIKDIMNGGSAAVAALLGDKQVSNYDRLPVANLMLSANNRLAQKLGRRPDIKIDPPITNDSERAHKAAEKRARIVETYDAVAKMNMLLPQLARWVPGYGFTACVVRQGMSRNREPFPIVELRDPFETFPGEWGVGQQPLDVAFCRIISPQKLAQMFPAHTSKILGDKGGYGGTYEGDRAGWSSQNGSGLEVYEYINQEGTWWVCPEKSLLLSYVPNILSRPCFYILKRFSFDRLTGQYDHVIGLMAAMARLNLLLIIATEDSVMAETNVTGDLAQGDHYKRGRNSINFLMPGSTVDRANSRIPFEAFQYMSNLERQLRVVAGYSVQDDGQSPNSFATGAGLQELKSEVGLEVREYFTVIQDGLTELDAIRMEWDEAFYSAREKTLSGVRSGAPFSEKYTPGRHINGDYVTRRVYGAMAGLDEPTKIVAILQLMQGRLMDDVTAMENLDGLEDHTRIRERIREQEAEQVIRDYLLAAAGQGEPKAMAAAIGMLPESEYKTMLEELYLSEPEQPEAVPGLPEGPEDVSTMLSRLTSGASGATPTMSAQTVTQVAA